MPEPQISVTIQQGHLAVNSVHLVVDREDCKVLDVDTQAKYPTVWGYGGSRDESDDVILGDDPDRFLDAPPTLVKIHGLPNYWRVRAVEDAGRVTIFCWNADAPDAPLLWEAPASEEGA